MLTPIIYFKKFTFCNFVIPKKRQKFRIHIFFSNMMHTDVVNNIYIQNFTFFWEFIIYIFLNIFLLRNNCSINILQFSLVKFQREKLIKQYQYFNTYAVMQAVHFIHILAREFLRYAYDTKAISISRSSKAKSRMSRSKRKRNIPIVGGGCGWQIRRIENVHPTECSGINSRIPALADVLARGSRGGRAIEWTAVRHPLAFYSPPQSRCRRVVAIRDDILLRLEQRMGTPRRPNVRKFHYAVQLVQKPRLARRITRATGIVSDYAIARITLRNSENFHFNIWLKQWI